MKTYKLSLASFDYIRDMIRENCDKDIEQKLIMSSEVFICKDGDFEYRYVEITDKSFAKPLIRYIDDTLKGESGVSSEWKYRHLAWREMLTKIKKELTED